MRTKLSIILLFLFMTPLFVTAQSHKSKYIGEADRKIKSLSLDDIEELRKGGGWGLAKAAELNGVPGPTHILEMEDEIRLAGAQKSKIQEIYNDMQTQAILLGNELIHLEKELDNGFLNKSIDQELLEKKIGKIGVVRSRLRIVHLSAHLKSSKVLTETQINVYNRLRGYFKDPCANIPEGHSAEMWKKHNGCK